MPQHFQVMLQPRPSSIPPFSSISHSMMLAHAEHGLQHAARILALAWSFGHTFLDAELVSTVT